LNGLRIGEETDRDLFIGMCSFGLFLVDILMGIINGVR
jgi:hypothetical protein